MKRETSSSTQVSSWANSVTQDLKALQHMQININTFTICRVPSHIRRGKEVYYEPAMVSIGPYYRGREELQVMEGHKLQHLDDFLQRNRNNTLEVYIKRLRDVEKQARKCYFEYINLTSEEFVKMLLLDGCFIIEYVLKIRDARRNPANKNIGTVNWLHRHIRDDLLLLENQIPFFVLEFLYDDLVPSVAREMEEGSIAQIIRRVLFPRTEINLNEISINHLLSLGYDISMQLDVGNADETRSPSFLKHVMVWLSSFCCSFCSNLIITLLYNILFCKHTSSREQGIKATKIPCASKLVEYGIKFKSRIGGHSMIAIDFKDGVLQIPPWIQIGEENKSSLFNLLAFDQCNTYALGKLSTYFRFMDFLIDTAKDVEILEECGIFVSYLKTSEETALFFNQINNRDYVEREDHYLVSVYEEINNFCDSKWQRERARLIRDYFSNPWATVSLIAATVLLILTFLQTFFTIYRK